MLCVCLRSIDVHARDACGFFSLPGSRRGLLIFTQAASLVNTFFKMAQGQVVKERSKKRIFHFSATNAELCSADLYEKARARSCLPGNVGNVLRGQEERREKITNGGKRKRRAKKKGMAVGGRGRHGCNDTS